MPVFTGLNISMLRAEDIQGEWPSADRFIIAGADGVYLHEYAPRWSASWRKHWHLPLHLHVVDPTPADITLAQSCADTVTWNRLDPEWVDSETKIYTQRTERGDDPDKARYIWLAGFYQVSRFWVTGHRITPSQKAVVTDMDACATRSPSQEWLDKLYRRTAFQKYKQRLMATFGSACGTEQAQWRRYSQEVEHIFNEQQGDSSVDQRLLKQVFSLEHNRLEHDWCCHHDLRDDPVETRWRSYPVWHLKGLRGKKVDIAHLV